MFGGLFTRWKLPVAYYFTSDSLNGAILKPIILQIIEKAEAIGLLVHSVTSDMGPVNLSMWRAFENIVCSRYSKIGNCIPHPIDNTRKLFFIADAPHLLKNLKATLINNKIIELPQKFVQTYNLSSSITKCEHLYELIDIQENLQFKFTPKISKKDISCSTFNRMKVNKARNILSQNVSSAMKFYAEEKKRPELNTTAAFIQVCSKWFTLITARTPKVALGKTANNIETKKKFDQNVEFLEFILRKRKYYV